MTVLCTYEKSEKGKAVLIYIRSYVDGTEKDGGYKQYELSSFTPNWFPLASCT